MHDRTAAMIATDWKVAAFKLREEAYEITGSATSAKLRRARLSGRADQLEDCARYLMTELKEK